MIGQCHKYKEYEIKPTKTINEFLRKYDKKVFWSWLWNLKYSTIETTINMLYKVLYFDVGVHKKRGIIIDIIIKNESSNL